METRQHQYQISRPKPIAVKKLPLCPPVTKLDASDSSSKVDAVPPPAAQFTGPRPLSDIRELSEPSVIDSIFARPGRTSPLLEQGRARTHLLPITDSPPACEKAEEEVQAPVLAKQNRHPPAHSASSSYSSSPEPPSFYNIPSPSVPRRSSSFGHSQRKATNHARKPSVRVIEPIVSKPHPNEFTVPNRGQSRSPIKETALRLDAIKSDANRQLPSTTYIRNPPRIDIIEFPTYRHPRVRVDLQVTAPLFVGGGSVEGQIKITVDENTHLRARRSLGIGAISVDLVGFEDVSGGRRNIFLALGTELLDATSPPPANMVEPANPLAPEERFWIVKPSVSMLPFLISLPLDTGPPPFASKGASIRFMICVTVLIRDVGNFYEVRASQDINVLATYDPDKALTSLPSPLTATDSISLPRFGRCESLKITAGLHRQVWVSGSSIFTDIHISNRTHKPVKRLELGLERDLLCYKHAIACTREKSASQARIFESNEQTLITRSCMKPGVLGWQGIEPHQSETRTCELELPRGHATVRCGKHFEVRFFLNITASISSSKTVSVQLPIILIHINSLDVVPNSVAQVAAAIEEKRRLERSRSRPRQRTTARGHGRNRSASSPRSRTELTKKPSYSQGRAFAAPRQQSADRQRARDADIDDLRRALDSSPRKNLPAAALPAILPVPAAQGLVIRKQGGDLSLCELKPKKSLASNNPLAGLIYRTPPLRRKISRPIDVKRENVPTAQLQHMSNSGSAHNHLDPSSYQQEQQNNRPTRSRGDVDEHNQSRDPNQSQTKVSEQSKDKKPYNPRSAEPYNTLKPSNPFKLIDPHALGLATNTYPIPPPFTQRAHYTDASSSSDSRPARHPRQQLLGYGASSQHRFPVSALPENVLRHPQRLDGAVHERSATSLSSRERKSQERREYLDGVLGPTTASEARTGTGPGTAGFEIPGLTSRGIRRKGTNGSLKEKGRAWWSDRVAKRLNRTEGDHVGGKGEGELLHGEEDGGWI